jgi:predicted Zn finger-like uncharacterized protein
MIIICHNCRSRYKVREDLVAAGPKQARCKNCGAVMLIRPPEGAVTPETELATFPPSEAPSSAPGMTPGPGTPGAGPAAEETASTGGSQPAEGEAEDGSAESALAKLEKRRREMEDEISGRLHKAALETLEFQDLELLGSKIKEIEANPDYRLEPDAQLFACIGCKTLFALFPEDPRQCPQCSGDTALVRGQDILRQYSMFNR